MNHTLQRFIDQLLKSGLVTQSQIKQIRSQLSEEEKVDESKSDQYVLNQLADSGHLTDFQAHALQEGKSDELVFDDYLLIDEIGQGGMGRVYKARHTLMQREVAVKFMLQDKPSRDSDERFRREVQGLSKLVHPNIVSAVDAGYRGQQCYLVMEFIDGMDLGAHVRKHGPMTFNEALAAIAQAAEGLKYVHRKQIVHRDIKPGNLLFTRDRTVKVLDVGLARFGQRGPNEDVDRTEDALTQSGAIVGTIDFMAPEQAMNSHEVTPAADVYSLGCTLHYLLTGKPPFRQRGKSVLERVVAHREMDIPQLSNLVFDAPLSFDPIFLKMLAKDPLDRYSDAGELLLDLKAAQRDHSAFCSGTTTILTQNTSPPNKIKARFLALCSCALLGVIGAVGWFASRPKSDRTLAAAESNSISIETESRLTIVQPDLPCDLMKYIDLAANASPSDRWELVDGKLTVPDGGQRKLLIPVSISTDYQLTGMIRRINGTGPFVLFLPVRGTSQCFLLIDSKRNQAPVSGFGFNSAGRLVVTEKTEPLPTDHATSFRVEVHSNGLRYFVDDHQLLDWQGKMNELKISGGWSATRDPIFLVGSNHDASFEVSALRVEQLAPPARLLTDDNSPRESK